MCRFDPDCGAVLGPDFEEVFDHDGNGVYTDCCGVFMMWDSVHEIYICPCCGKRISRREFLIRYVEAYGPECFSCRTNFPQCVICHKNHQAECDRHEFG